jgi:hypothetical protein
VKKDESIVKKFLVLSLLVMYLLIAVTNILYLPKYNPLRAVNNYSGIKTDLVLNPTHQHEHSAANIFVLLHRVYQSPFENKRETLSGPSQTAFILVSLITGVIALFALLRGTGKYFKMPGYSRGYAYLNYCTLRI